MSLLSDDKWSAVIDRLSGSRWRFFQLPGNAGDDMIRQGTLQLLRRSGVEINDTEFDGILISGGGNLGTMYRDYREIRTGIREIANDLGLPVVILPQSICGEENLEGATAFAREAESARIMNAPMCPDMALAYDIDCIGNPIYGEGIFLRNDKESAVKAYNYDDPTETCSNAREYVDLASQFKSIITDRLHFAIAGLIANRDVTLLPNSYHKNESMWKTWLSRLGCKWMDLSDVAGKVLAA